MNHESDIFIIIINIIIFNAETAQGTSLLMNLI